MKAFLFRAAMLFLLSTPAGSYVAAQSATTRSGTFDASGVTEYSQYLYIAPGAHITIPTGQEWVIASQYIFISPSAVIDGGGDMILDDAGNLGNLSESVAWAGQPATIDGGNSELQVRVINRNPGNILLGAVDIVPSSGDIAIANATHTLYIGNNLTWATTHGDASGLSGNDLLLENNDLVFTSTATETGYLPAGFAVTNGTGHVVKENYTGAWTFPVGIAENDYTPAAVTNAIANGVHVSVQDYATSASGEITGVTGNGIQRTWNIYAGNATGNSFITLQHNSSTNQDAFDDASQFITRWSGSSPNATGDNTLSQNAWQSNTVAAGTNGDLSSAGAVSGSSMQGRNYSDFAISATDEIAYYTKSSSQLSPLPVTLLHFNATSSSCTAILTWQTAEESSFSRFELERAAGNGGNFIKLAAIAPKGNNSSYTYTDPHPLQGNDIYRLRMIDMDGHYTYSGASPVTIRCDNNGPVTIYPNPARTQTTLDGLKGEELIQLYNARGQLILQERATGVRKELNISHLAGGIYQLVIRRGTESIQKMILVKE